MDFKSPSGIFLNTLWRGKWNQGERVQCWKCGFYTKRGFGDTEKCVCTNSAQNVAYTVESELQVMLLLQHRKK